MSWRLLSIPSVILGMSTAAPAQVEVLGPGDYHCSAPAGDFFNSEIPPLEVGKKVTVRVRLIADHPHPDWLEQVSIYFRTPTGRMDVKVGEGNGDADHIYVALLDAHNEVQLLAKYPVTNLWVPLEMTLDKKGMLRVESARGVGKLNLGTALPMKTELHCHSGEFEIQVQRSGVESD